MPTTDKTRQLLTQRIDACKRKGFLPSELLDMVHAVYDRQLEARENAHITIPPDETLTDSSLHGQGAPLLAREQFPFDAEQAQNLLTEFLRLLPTISPSLSEPARIVTQSLQDGSLDDQAAMQAHLRNDEGFFNAWGARMPSAPRLVPMLIQAAMTPSLEQAARQLTTKLPSDTWTHGHCPVCGSLPIFSELREKEGFRYHLCGFCHAEYRSPRLQCPFCLETDTAKLSYYEAREEAGIRLSACATCGMYIKVADFRNLDRKSLPLIDDLESLALDVLAREKQLKRPTLSAWGF